MFKRSISAGVGLAAMIMVTAGGAQAVAIHQCADTPFGKGSLTCVVENNTVFTGLDESVFSGKNPGVFKVNGNNDESDVEAALNYAFGSFTDISSVATSVGGKGGNGFEISLTSDDSGPRRPTRPGKGGVSTSFTWAYDGETPLAYMTVRAGPDFAIFDISGMVSGYADTEELLVNPAGKALNISHISFWSKSLPNEPAAPGEGGHSPEPGAVQVSAPSVMGVAIMGVAGLVLLGRFQRNRN